MRKQEKDSVESWLPPTRGRVASLRKNLAGYYGLPIAMPHRDPLGELILTVLSQSTNDRNRDVAFLRLTQALPTWTEVRDADVEVVEEAIRPGGISKVKSKRIQQILQQVSLEYPDLNLEQLDDLGVDEARDYLCGLPGVGRKTTACVLMFAYGMHDIPVDTHVQRVGTRLGLFKPKASLEKLHDEMLILTPKGAGLELHVNLLRHGRRICHAQNPRCGQCPVSRGCPAKAQLLKDD